MTATTIRWEVSDVTPALAEIAKDKARFYVGTFPFMLDMQAKIRAGQTISAGQVKGILNSVRYNPAEEAAYRMTPPPAPRGDIELFNQLAPVDGRFTSTPVAAPFKGIADGTYTVVLDAESGDYRTLRITTPKAGGNFANNNPGTKIAAFLMGPDNERDFQGFASVSPTGVIKVWADYRNDSAIKEALTILIGAGNEDLAEMGVQYALKSGRCCRCGRKLTVPTSLFAGMGPECATRD